MKELLSKRVVAICCIAVAVLFVVRVPASRLRDKVVRSISAALNRNVDVSSLRIRLLPRPGFELQNLAVYENSSFGAEPLLRAPEVTASLQLTALLRGHIQIATLSLSDPSVNLAHNAEGVWNFQDLLQRTSSISVAPTSSRGRAPRFPYIEATGARINFKNGAEKLHFALADAKFALWQESDNTWGMRLRARPIRTDENLSDTGTVAFSGSWQRAAVLHGMPFQFSMEWDRAEIGQVSKLVYGSDQGWRGTGTLSAHVAGTPDNAKITSDATIDNFRAQDVFSDANLRLAAHCSTDYNLITRALSNLECIAPSGDGVVELKGSASGFSGMGRPFSDFDVYFIAHEVPAQSLLAFIRHAKPKWAPDLAADGIADATLQLSRTRSQEVRLQGSGELQQLVLSASSGASVAVGAVPFSVIPATVKASEHLRSHSVKRKSVQSSSLTPSLEMDSPGPKIEIGPFSVSLGRSTPLQIHGFLSRDGYQVALHGNAGLKRLLEAASIARIPVPAVNADGTTIIDIRISRDWSSDHQEVLGTAQLHSVSARIRGLNDPLTVANANLALAQKAVNVAIISASAAGATWRGSLQVPRGCLSGQDCELQFNLHTGELSAASLNKSLNPALRKRAWYRFLSTGEDPPSYLLHARAAGKVSIDKLTLGKTACSHVTADLRLDQGRLKIVGLKAALLDGSIAGNWEINFGSKPPEYRGAGNLNGISLESVSGLMHDPWVDGVGDAKYRFTAAGASLQELLDSADLAASFQISRAIFPHVVLTEQAGPLQAQSFSGGIQLHNGELTFADAQLATSRRNYNVSGTASLKGALNLKLSAEGTSALSITGTVLETRVSANPTTAAALKP